MIRIFDRDRDRLGFFIEVSFALRYEGFVGIK